MQHLLHNGRERSFCKGDSNRTGPLQSLPEIISLWGRLDRPVALDAIIALGKATGSSLCDIIGQESGLVSYWKPPFLTRGTENYAGNGWLLESLLCDWLLFVKSAEIRRGKKEGGSRPVCNICTYNQERIKAVDGFHNEPMRGTAFGLLRLPNGLLRCDWTMPVTLAREQQSRAEKSRKHFPSLNIMSGETRLHPTIVEAFRYQRGQSSAAKSSKCKQTLSICDHWSYYWLWSACFALRTYACLWLSHRWKSYSSTGEMLKLVSVHSCGTSRRIDCQANGRGWCCKKSCLNITTWTQKRNNFWRLIGDGLE